MLGIQTIVLGTLRTRQQLADALQSCAALGYQCVEVAQAPYREVLGTSDSQILLELCDRFRIKLAGLAGGSLSSRVDFLKASTQEPYLYYDGASTEEIGYALSHGFRVALHPHAFSLLSDLDDLTTLVQRLKHEGYDTSKVGCIFDAAHAYIAGDTLAAYVRSEIPIIAFHAKDWTEAVGRQSHRYAKGFCIPGLGDVDVRESIIEFVQHNPGSPLIWELDYSCKVRADATAALNFFMRCGIPVRSDNRGMKYCFIPDPGRGPSHRCRTVFPARETMRDCYLQLLLDARTVMPYDFGALVRVDSPRSAERVIVATDDVVPSEMDVSSGLDAVMAGVIMWRDSPTDEFHPLTSIHKGRYGEMLLPVFNEFNLHHVRFLVYLRFSTKTFAASSKVAWRVCRELADQASRDVEQSCLNAAQHVLTSLAGSRAEDIVAEKLPDVLQRVMGFEVLQVFSGATFSRIELLPEYRSAVSEHRAQSLNPSRQVSSGSDVLVGTIVGIPEFQEEWTVVATESQGTSVLTDDHLAVFGSVRQTTEVLLRRFREDERRRQRLSDTRHLLISPLADVRRYSKRLQGRFRSSDSSIVRNALADMVRDCTAMIRMVNSGPAASTDSDVQPEAKKKCDIIKDVIASAIRHCTDLLDERGFDRSNIGYLGLRECPLLNVDPVQFQHVFKNLIVNAIKYAKPLPAELKLIFRFRIEEDESLVICVDDYGVGVPMGLEERIFDEGDRGNFADSTKIPGDGLGLAVASAFVTSHNGTLSLTSNAEPTTFSLHLPPECLAYQR